MLSQQDIDFYYEEGYLSVEDVLTQDEVEDLRRVTDEFVEKSREVTEHTDTFDLEPGHTPDAPKLRRLKSPADHHPIYDKTLRHPRILDIAEQIFGRPGVRTNGNKLNIKYAHFGSPVEWHQDWAFYPHTNDDVLAIGVAFDDMNLENGCLMVVPKSHKGQIWDHHQDGEFIGAVTDSLFQPDEAVPVQVRAGGISIHHVRTLHGSAPNLSENPRRLYLLQLLSLDAWPLSGAKDWDEFNNLILRGEPTNQPHLTPCPVRMPLPSSDKLGSIYEVQTVLETKIFANQER